MADSDGLSALGFFLPWRNKVKMSETPKKPANVIVCLCCNSHLQKVYDCIDIFGLLALKENVAEKIQQIGGIDHTCQPPEYKNLEMSTNLCIVRMSFSTMSEYSPKIIRRPSECSRRLSVRMSRYRCVTCYNVYDYVMYSRVPG